jgi:hypothetical protein
MSENTLKYAKFTKVAIVSKVILSKKSNAGSITILTSGKNFGGFLKI